VTGDLKMKKIYAFNFDDEECLTDDFKSKIRLVAYLLYDSIYGYDDLIPLNINKNIVFNRIHEGFDNSYYLDSDIYDDGIIRYEPFLLGDRTFALTVDDELISEDEIRYLFNSVLNMIKIRGNVNVFSENYFSKDINDERNRNKAINSLCEKMKLRLYKKVDYIKKIVYGGKIKKNVSYYGRY